MAGLSKEGCLLHISVLNSNIRLHRHVHVSGISKQLKDLLGGWEAIRLES
jgi:hypothetical protein